MAEGLGLQVTPSMTQGLNLADSMNHGSSQQELGLQPQQDSAMLRSWLQSIVGQHQDKNFVQRISNPSIFPNLDLGDGQVGTHLMSWGTMGKEKTPIVFPTIQQHPTTGQLEQLDMDTAFERAVKSGEYIPFKSEHEADLFSREYKQLWNK